MVGLVVAIHQHLLVGEMDAPGLLLILLVLLLLGALVLAGRSILLGWTLELLGAGALDLGGLRIFLVRLGLGNLFQMPLLGRLLAFIIPAWPGLHAQDLLGQLPDGSKDGALACGVLARASEAAAKGSLPMTGPAGIVRGLRSEVADHQVSELAHLRALRLCLRGVPELGGHLHFLEGGEDRVLAQNQGLMGVGGGEDLGWMRRGGEDLLPVVLFIGWQPGRGGCIGGIRGTGGGCVG